MLYDWLVVAEGAGKNSSSGSGIMQMVLLLVIFGGLFYFFLIRPQQKQRREQQTMIDSLRRGDRIVTIGGIHGRVEGIKDRVVLLKVADNVKIELNKASIAQVVKRKDEDEGGLQESE
jgi:preprotein translocase subunit YajC